MTYVRVAAFVISLLLLSLGAAWMYQLGGKDKSAELAEYQAKAAKQLADATQKAREAEQRHTQEMAAIADRHEKDKQNAVRDEKQLVADLRAGNQRLRALWRGCEATGALAASGVADAAAREREESAARIIGIGRAADDWIKRLQDVIRADRKGQGD